MTGTAPETPKDPTETLPPEETVAEEPQPEPETEAQNPNPAPGSPLKETVAGTVERAREGLSRIPSPREAVRGALHKARETLIGSGSLTNEIGKLGADYVDTAVAAISTPPKVLWDLVRLHPIKAVQDAVSGSKRIIEDCVSIATSPTRLAAAGVATVAGAAATGIKTAVHLPFDVAGFALKSPFKAWKTIDEGLQYIVNVPGRVDKWAEGQIGKITKG